MKIQLLTSSICILLSLNSYANNSSGIKLKVSENGTVVSIQDQTSKSLTANETTDISLSSPAMITLEGRIPVLMVRINAGSNNVELNPPHC
jgi:hypothetical protein